MNIERFEDEGALSSALAARVLERIIARPSLVLGLPTGRTPLGLYRELRERSGGALAGESPQPNAGIDMTFSFADLIAHAAKTRRLGGGTIIGSGTVSNKLDGGPGKPVGTFTSRCCAGPSRR